MYDAFIAFDLSVYIFLMQLKNSLQHIPIQVPTYSGSIG